MKSSAKNISLNSYDDIFSTEETREDAKREKVTDMPLSELHPFPDHPFQVRDDDSMKETVESIKEYGVLVPAIVRPRADGGYELISGHRRKHACELAGLPTMPVIVRDLDDDAATIIMVDSNIQRENILPSERAKAYKMKLDAIKRQAGRPSKENAPQVAANFRSDDEVAKGANISGDTVRRYIRLNELTPQLQQMVDDKKIAMTPRRGTVVPQTGGTDAFTRYHRKRTGHPLALTGPAAEKIQRGGPFERGQYACHYVGGKETGEKRLDY